MKINQSIINRLSNEHEPRTKKFTAMRLHREGQYQAMNQELIELGTDMSVYDEYRGQGNDNQTDL